jgi:hypothetical protein
MISGTTQGAENNQNQLGITQATESNPGLSC